MSKLLPTSPVISVQTIGRIYAAQQSVQARPDYTDTSVLEIDVAFLDGLVGIERFSHFHVIYYQDQADAWLEKRAWPSEHPYTIPAPDPRAGGGVFTIRAPCRPARLGSCVVELISREGNRLTVRGLDALDGSPVVDLKIYVPAFDAVPSAIMPEHWHPSSPMRYQAAP
jgi:tRNA-Thr(GGU) m(6)t(6)A37 methyltransferase TsaA